MDRSREIVLIDLNPTYVVTLFELAKCLVENFDQGRRLCDCVNSQIWRATHRQGGVWELGKGSWNCFDES